MPLPFFAGVGVVEDGFSELLSDRQKQPKTKKINDITIKQLSKFRRNDGAADLSVINLVGFNKISLFLVNDFRIKNGQ